MAMAMEKAMAMNGDDEGDCDDDDKLCLKLEKKEKERGNTLMYSEAHLSRPPLDKTKEGFGLEESYCIHK